MPSWQPRWALHMVTFYFLAFWLSVRQVFIVDFALLKIYQLLLFEDILFLSTSIWTAITQPHFQSLNWVWVMSWNGQKNQENRQCCHMEMTSDRYHRTTIIHQVAAQERGYHADGQIKRGYHEGGGRIDRGYHAGGGRIKDPRGPLGLFATTLRLLSYLVLIFSMIMSLDVDNWWWCWIVYRTGRSMTLMGTESDTRRSSWITTQATITRSRQKHNHMGRQTTLANSYQAQSISGICLFQSDFTLC